MNSVSIYYQNVRGLRTKTASFIRNVLVNSYDIVCITETWLVDGIHNSEIFDDRYIVWRNDRNYKRTAQTKGGGVLIAVRRELASTSPTEWHSSAEDLWVTVTLRSKKPRSTCRLHIGIA